MTLSAHSEEMLAGDVVMVAALGPAHPARELLSPKFARNR